MALENKGGGSNRAGILVVELLNIAASTDFRWDGLRYVKFGSCGHTQS